MISSTILTLIVIPAVYALIKGFRLPRGPGAEVPEPCMLVPEWTNCAARRQQNEGKTTPAELGFTPVQFFHFYAVACNRRRRRCELMMKVRS